MKLPAGGRSASRSATSARPERDGVGEHVPGVGEQRQGGADDPGDDLGRHEGDDQREGGAEPAGVGVGCRQDVAVVVAPWR